MLIEQSSISPGSIEAYWFILACLKKKQTVMYVSASPPFYVYSIYTEALTLAIIENIKYSCISKMGGLFK